MSDVGQVLIAEQFHSVQGEGPHAGTPAIFLRLAGCNLCCGGHENAHRDKEDMEPEGDATWVCDTIDVWREPNEFPSPDNLVSQWGSMGWLDKLREGAHLVLTGGEPLLDQHRDPITNFMLELAESDVRPFLEVETNGTIEPGAKIGPYVDQWNVSMKLSNSGMGYHDRINPDAINHFCWTHEDVEEDSAIFKFVVASADDYEEVQEIQGDFNIPDSMISLMPAGQTQDQLRETYVEVAEMCKEQGWRFSPRLQVDIFGEVTGV